MSPAPASGGGRSGDSPPLRAAIITLSTSKARGEGHDTSGERLAAFADRQGLEIVDREVLPDERELIAGRLRFFADQHGCELILTTGGTGFTPNDLTPEATRDVIDREAPGLGEAMRLASREHTPHWMLSRAIAGIRHRTLIVNFPGSPKAIDEAAEAIAEALPHALALVTGRAHPHTRDE